MRCIVKELVQEKWDLGKQWDAVMSLTFAMQMRSVDSRADMAQTQADLMINICHRLSWAFCFLKVCLLVPNLHPDVLSHSTIPFTNSTMVSSFCNCEEFKIQKFWVFVPCPWKAVDRCQAASDDSVCLRSKAKTWMATVWYRRLSLAIVPSLMVLLIQARLITQKKRKKKTKS